MEEGTQGQGQGWLRRRRPRCGRRAPHGAPAMIVAVPSSMAAVDATSSSSMRTAGAHGITEAATTHSEGAPASNRESGMVTAARKTNRGNNGLK